VGLRSRNHPLGYQAAWYRLELVFSLVNETASSYALGRTMSESQRVAAFRIVTTIALCANADIREGSRLAGRRAFSRFHYSSQVFRILRELRGKVMFEQRRQKEDSRRLMVRCARQKCSPPRSISTMLFTSLGVMKWCVSRPGNTLLVAFAKGPVSDPRVQKREARGSAWRTDNVRGI
jgi:hypothetical protein